MRVPCGRHFTQLGKDQLEDYAQRTGVPLAEHEKWLGSYLDYDPS
jgi:5-methyltetrahydrofolate--homocysteine methyltransferase